MKAKIGGIQGIPLSLSLNHENYLDKQTVCSKIGLHTNDQSG